MARASLEPSTGSMASSSLEERMERFLLLTPAPWHASKASKLTLYQELLIVISVKLLLASETVTSRSSTSKLAIKSWSQPLTTMVKFGVLTLMALTFTHPVMTTRLRSGAQPKENASEHPLSVNILERPRGIELVLWEDIQTLRVPDQLASVAMVTLLSVLMMGISRLEILLIQPPSSRKSTIHWSGLRSQNTAQTASTLLLALMIPTFTSMMQAMVTVLLESVRSTMPPSPALIGVKIAVSSDQSVTLMSSSSSTFQAALKTHLVLPTPHQPSGQVTTASSGG